jgi:hypothetical protein
MSMALIYKTETFFLSYPFNIQSIQCALQERLFPSLDCCSFVETFMKADVIGRLYDGKPSDVECVVEVVVYFKWNGKTKPTFISVG